MNGKMDGLEAERGRALFCGVSVVELVWHQYVYGGPVIVTLNCTFCWLFKKIFFFKFEGGVDFLLLAP